MEAPLRTAGCHVAAGTALGALRRALDNHLRTPDLIVTDLWLGLGESGLDVIAGLRDDCQQAIPALILTGETQPPAPHELPGRCHLVRKPVGPARLFMLCGQILGASPTARTAIPASPPRSPPACGS